MDPETEEIYRKLEESISNLVDEKYTTLRRQHESDDEPKSDGTLWKIIAAAAGLSAVIGLFVNLMMSFSDLKVSIREIQSRHEILDAKIEAVVRGESEFVKMYGDKIREIDLNGSRSLIGAQATIKLLQEQIDLMKERVENLNSSLLQHNAAMIDLYKKDTADGKKDYKIPYDAPKYHSGQK